MSDDAINPEHLERLGVFTPERLGQFCERERGTSEALVERFLSARTVNVAVGDSGLGKTPLMLQLCVSVASGCPFLRMACRQGLVLYLGFEDGAWRVHETLQRLAQHMGLAEVPPDLCVWLEEVGRPLPLLELVKVVEQLKPVLIVIDPIRLMMPTIEDSGKAAECIRSLMQLTHHGAAVLAIHHLRKSGRNEFPTKGLEDDGCHVISWLEQAAGARAIINHSSTRIAFDKPANTSGSDLVMMWNRRSFGDTGPLRLRKVLDPDDGEPLGWEALTGEDRLSQIDRDRFHQLAQEFRRMDALAVCGGKSNDVTGVFISRLENLGLVRKIERGKWRKLGVG